MRTKLTTFGAILVFTTVLIGGAYAACSSCSSCGVDKADLWTSGEEFLSSTPGMTTISTENQPAQIASSGQPQTIEPQNIPQNYILACVNNDLADQNGYDYNYIQGMIKLLYGGFLEDDGTLKSVVALSNVLGAAGITENDNVILCGNCNSCNDPLLVFWIMNYLGHQGDIKLLEGESTDWRIAGSIMQSGFSTRQATTYVSTLNEEALAEYNEIANA